MSLYYKTEGIILEKINRGEQDRVFRIFTKDFGKLDLWAISERKISSKLRGALEEFYYSSFEFVEGKNRMIITDAFLEDQYEEIRKHLPALQVAWRITQALGGLIPFQQSDQDVWSLLKSVFSILNKYPQEDVNLDILYLYFIWNLLKHLGYQPHTVQCLNCKRGLAGQVFFIFARGGFLCHDCRKRQSILLSRDEGGGVSVSSSFPMSIASLLRASSYADCFEDLPQILDNSHFKRVSFLFLSYIQSQRPFVSFTNHI